MRPKWLIRIEKNFFYYGMAAIVGKKEIGGTVP